MARQLHGVGEGAAVGDGADREGGRTVVEGVATGALANPLVLAGDGGAQRCAPSEGAAGQPLHTAAQKFEEAAQLDSRWPDPYLGLARTYLYGLDDLDRAIAALHEAENRGYRPGNRELVQLADGYRSRAERMRRDAQGVRGLDQEKDYLQKALEDYKQAFDLYRQAMGFGEVSAHMRQVQDRIDEVERRLDEIKGRGLGDLLREIFGKS